MSDDKKTFKGVQHLADDNFDQVLKDAGDMPVFVDFFAEWCGPCQMAAPVVEELAKDYEGKAVIAKLDVDQNPESARKYGVMSIPTVIMFKNGEIVEKDGKQMKAVGFPGKAGYMDLIDNSLT